MFVRLISQVFILILCLLTQTSGASYSGSYQVELYDYSFLWELSDELEHSSVEAKLGAKKKYKCSHRKKRREKRKSSLLQARKNTRKQLDYRKEG